MTTERDEDYLKIIASIVEEKGYAKVKDVAKELELGPSTVTGMFKKLDKEGYINYEKYGGVTLTEKGTEIAHKTKETYGMLKEFLMHLGVDKTIAEEDACKIEHILNPKTAQIFKKFVEFTDQKEEPKICIEHFRYFVQTGEYVFCSPETRDKCPVHGKKK
ncbi:Iron-dependent repressor IdeR/DtxR [Methanosarcina barkeri str. Wiesmoor]|uniref:Iron-dependent repressor IdeR/DtxR n=2 Tax=Methanosarcina barkeri TaxID=2208 RepID=A0A0E3QQR2_METBA|nr:metal-dependent transcriptional regulator [Methanosarcina barkeri]AKB52523.1 Iron-dependent repressor IdeR/DtxR [Methanosarcina barkeri str. Wiesmoor]